MKTSRLIKISLSHVQLQCGSSTPIFALDFKRYSSWLDPGWITSLWKFLHKTSLKITVLDQWAPTQPRHSDITLMDYFVSLSLCRSDLVAVN